MRRIVRAVVAGYIFSLPALAQDHRFSFVDGAVIDTPTGHVTSHWGNGGSNPNWYDIYGLRQYGQVAIDTQLYGFGNLAQALSVYANQSQLSVDDGCALGGFGARPDARGAVGATDQVAICEMLSSALPIATLTYAAEGPSDYEFSDDPSAEANSRYTEPGFGGARTPTGTAQSTMVTFTAPLKPAQVAALRVNMIVRTSTGWTGFIKTWDAQGRSISVDTWVPVLIGKLPIYVGYDPRALAVSPTGPLQKTVTLYINANQTFYGENMILTHPEGAYCLFGFACAVEGKELVLVNNAKPFVRGGGTCVTGQPCTSDEYTPFNDSPRDVTVLLGSGGKFPISTAVGIYGGLVDKGLVVGEGAYAGVLVSPYGDHPVGDSFMSQVATGNCFSVKNPLVQDYTMRIDCRTGAMQQGGQGQKVSTLRGTLSWQGNGPAVVDLTTDGARPNAAGENRPVAIPPGSSVSMTVQLQVSNPGDKSRHLEWRVICQWQRLGAAPATVVANALSSGEHVLEFASPGISDRYSVACGVDPTNNFGRLIVENKTSTIANWVGAYTATLSPL